MLFFSVLTLAKESIKGKKRRRKIPSNTSALPPFPSKEKKGGEKKKTRGRAIQGETVCPRGGEEEPEVRSWEPPTPGHSGSGSHGEHLPREGQDEGV